MKMHMQNIYNDKFKLKYLNTIKHNKYLINNLIKIKDNKWAQYDK